MVVAAPLFVHQTRPFFISIFLKAPVLQCNLLCYSWSMWLEQTQSCLSSPPSTPPPSCGTSWHDYSVIYYVPAGACGWSRPRAATPPLLLLHLHHVEHHGMTASLPLQHLIYSIIGKSKTAVVTTLNCQ